MRGDPKLARPQLRLILGVGLLGRVVRQRILPFTTRTPAAAPPPVVWSDGA